MSYFIAISSILLSDILFVLYLNIVLLCRDLFVNIITSISLKKKKITKRLFVNCINLWLMLCHLKFCHTLHSKIKKISSRAFFNTKNTLDSLFISPNLCWLLLQLCCIIEMLSFSSYFEFFIIFKIIDHIKNNSTYCQNFDRALYFSWRSHNSYRWLRSLRSILIS